MLTKNKTSEWINKFSISSGQFFSLREDWKGFDYFFYQYEDSINYVIVEPGELTFKIYDDSELVIQNEEVFKIPLANNTKANSYYESFLVQLSSDENYKLFSKIFKCFIIDLYFNDSFKECGRIHLVKLALESIPLIQGIIDKTLFYHTVKLANNSYVPEQNRDLCGTIKDRLSVIQKGKNNLQISFRKVHEKKIYYYYANWLTFLSNSFNERYFNEENKWFQKNLDSELILLKKQYYSASRILGMGKEPMRTANKFSSLMIKRYGTFEAMSLSKGKITGCLMKWISIILLFTTAILIIGDVLFYNINPSNDSIMFFFDGTKNIPFVFWMDVVWSVFLSFVYFKHQLFPAIFLPRLIIAIISGWLLFISAEELLKIDYNIGYVGVTITSVIGMLLLFVFMLNEMRDYAPSMNGGRILIRSLHVILIAFVISFFFGFFVMNSINKKFISIDNFLVKESGIVKSQEMSSVVFIELEPIYENLDYLLNDLDSLVLRDFVISSDKLALKDSIHNNTHTLKSDKTFQNLKSNKLSEIHETRRKIRSLVENLPEIDSELMKKLDEDVKGLNMLINSISKMNKIAYLRALSNIIETIQNLKQSCNNSISKIKDQRLGMIGADNNKEMIDNLVGGIKVKGNPIRAQVYTINFYFDTLDITSFPNMIFLRSVLAMFIGVFLQLIIQDKSITEPI